MKLALFFLLHTCLFGLLGCTQLQSKEEQCLQSAKMEFKDPDSGKVLQNIGDRGLQRGKSDGVFWIRYSATNSYGARVSSNMACEKSDAVWVRAKGFEKIVVLMAGLKVQEAIYETRIAKTKASNDALKACKTQACKREVEAESRLYQLSSSLQPGVVEKEADEKVQRLIFDETGSLEKYE